MEAAPAVGRKPSAGYARVLLKKEPFLFKVISFLTLIHSDTPPHGCGLWNIQRNQITFQNKNNFVCAITYNLFEWGDKSLKNELDIHITKENKEHTLAKQTIYLKNELEDRIRAISSREGKPISEVIRQRLESSFEQESLIERLENKVDAIFATLHLLAGDIGYVAGATRASTKSYENIFGEGSNQEQTILNTLNVLSKQFIGREN